MGYEVGGKRNVATHYGPRTTDGQFGGQESSKEGLLKTAEWDFSYSNLPVAGTTALTFKLPANAMIKSAVIYITTTLQSYSFIYHIIWIIISKHPIW